MRAIWTGAITFGLVNVPVKVYSATEDHDTPLHQVHDKDGGRIRYQRRCEVCGKIVSYGDINKAYDDGDTTIILTAEDLKSLPEEKSREIEVVEFVPNDQVDPIRFDRSYFLEPDSKSPKAYALLRKTLEKSDRTAIVHFALRQKTRLGALRVHDDVLLLQSLLWDDEVREADFGSLGDSARISARELEMSMSLVKSFEADFEPEKFGDDYQEQLRALIEAKRKKGDTVDTDETFGRSSEDDDEGEGGEVLDLMEALSRSVARSREGRASSSSSKKAAATKPAAKKPAAKPATRKPAAAKTAAAKTPATKKPATKRAAPKKAS